MKQIIVSIFLLLSSVVCAEERKSFFDGTKTIHLKFTNIIDGQYAVDVLWMPDDGLAPQLVGPATISFVKNRGRSFSVLAEAFHLPIDVLNEFGLLKYDNSGDYHTLPVDLSKVHSIEYGSDEGSIFNNPYHLYYDKPIVGIVPFFFEDIDFDNKDELILINTRAGQRWVDSYTIYKATYKGGNIYSLATDEPFNMLDQKTTFNKENRTIDVFSSGGACGSTNEKFQLINGKYASVEFVEWVSVENDEKIACIESIYTVINDKRILKSKSESYWDSEQGKYIELDTKYY
jgi:hypothetical protein